MTAAIGHMFENLVLCKPGKLFFFTLAVPNISLLYKISLKSIKHMYHGFREFCAVRISYGVFENIYDTYYSFVIIVTCMLMIQKLILRVYMV